MSVCVSLSVCLPVCLPAYPPTHPHTYLPTYLIWSSRWRVRCSCLGGTGKSADNNIALMVIDRLIIQTETFCFILPFTQMFGTQQWQRICTLGVSTSGWSNSAGGYPLQEHCWHHLSAACALLEYRRRWQTPPVLPPGCAEAASEKCDLVVSNLPWAPQQAPHRFTLAFWQVRWVPDPGGEWGETDTVYFFRLEKGKRIYCQTGFRKRGPVIVVDAS